MIYWVKIDFFKLISKEPNFPLNIDHLGDTTKKLIFRQKSIFSKWSQNIVFFAPEMLTDKAKKRLFGQKKIFSKWYQKKPIFL